MFILKCRENRKNTILATNVMAKTPTITTAAMSTTQLDNAYHIWIHMDFDIKCCCIAALYSHWKNEKWNFTSKKANKKIFDLNSLGLDVVQYARCTASKKFNSNNLFHLLRKKYFSSDFLLCSLQPQRTFTTKNLPNNFRN